MPDATLVSDDLVSDDLTMAIRGGEGHPSREGHLSREGHPSPPVMGERALPLPLTLTPTHHPVMGERDIPSPPVLHERRTSSSGARIDPSLSLPLALHGSALCSCRAGATLVSNIRS